MPELTFSEQIAKTYPNELTQEAITIYRKIDVECPELIAHIASVDNNVQDEKDRLANTKAARSYSGIFRGCLWFLDPVTEEPLLEKKDWIMACMNEDIWLPISITYNSLIPRIITGSLTNIVAVYAKTKEDFVALGTFFTEESSGKVSIIKQRTLCLCDERWLLFENQLVEKYTYRNGYILTLPDNHSVEFVAPTTLIPIHNTIHWRETPVKVTGLTDIGYFPSITSIPPFLEKYFFVQKKS